jgi:hypothetical protein
LLIWSVDVGGRWVSCELKEDTAVSECLKPVMTDLGLLQGMLLSDDLDPRLLSDFRDVLDRIRNVAWAAQQSVASHVSGEGPTAIDSLLAAERIRATYQLCRFIQEDLGRNEIDFQKGQLTEIRALIAELSKQLKEKL